MSAVYRIIDEPRPGGLAHLTVNPFWPLIGMMLGGAWCAWPWFILNALALGNPTRGREILLAVAGAVGTVLIFFVIAWLFGSGMIAQSQVKYAVLVIIVWKLGIGYWLHEMQARGFELYRYFGGVQRNGLFVVAVAAFARGSVIAFSASPLWQLLVS